jgi:hypothetical protein
MRNSGLFEHVHGACKEIICFTPGHCMFNDLLLSVQLLMIINTKTVIGKAILKIRETAIKIRLRLV